MSAMEQIRAKAKAANRHIVLAEGTEERTVQAAARIVERGIARVTLVGPAEEVRAKAAQFGVSLEGVAIVDPATDPRTEGYALALYELRKAKGMTPEEARKLVTENTLYFGTMMLKMGDADGLVSGACHSTADTLRPALQIIKTKKGVTTASSCFVMECPNTAYGQNGVLIFADCAVNIEPDAQQLAAIAIASAETAKTIAEIDEPKVAMLSFSTKGSGKGDMVDKVRQATELVKELAPQLQVDGELQADAALVEKVGHLKSPGSPVAGRANVLIFPDLQAGNIGYKLVQRLAGAEAIGPICQGFRRPINDLSRGCSVEDVVSVAAITAVQAQNL